MIVGLILLCLAVLLLSMPITPVSPKTGAFVLALVALLLIAVGRHGAWW